VAVTEIAACDPTLGLVEQGDEAVPCPDPGKPCHRINRLSQEPDVLGWQPAGIDIRDDLGGIERPGAEIVVHDVVPGLEDEQSADQGLIQASATEKIQVVQVTELAAAPPGGELLRQGLL
jgi:hypothetical protein